jgi:hypothetical protein
LSSRNTVIIAVIFFLMAGFYYFYEVKGGPARDEARKRETRLFSFNAQDVTGIDLKRGSQELRFVKKGADWLMEKPLEARADSAGMEFFAKSLEVAKKGETVEESPGDLKKFGLDEPPFTLTVTVGKDAHTLILGQTTIDGRYFYGRLPSSPAVFLVGTNFKFHMEKKVAEYRDRSIISFPADDIYRVVTHGGDHTYIFEKDKSQWTLAHPRIPRPNNDEITNFVKSLFSLQAREFFPDTVENRKKFGLDEARNYMELYGSDGKPPAIVRMGRVDPVKSLIYVQAEGSGELFGVGFSEEKKFLLDPVDFIRSTVAQFETIDVVFITASFDGKQLRLQRRQEVQKENPGVSRWDMILPVKKEVEPEKVLSVLRSASSLYSLDAVFIEKPLAHYGLDKPRLTVRGQGADGKVLFEIDFGGKTGIKKHPNSIYARVKGEDAIVLVNGDLVREMRNTLFAMTSGL